MSDYIRREDAKHLLCRFCIGELTCKHHGDCDRIEAVNKIPAADVEDVVRCKDCEYWASTLTPAERDELAKRSFGGDGVCDYWECDGLTATDYCSQAKRRKSDGKNTDSPQ